MTDAVTEWERELMPAIHYSSEIWVKTYLGWVMKAGFQKRECWRQRIADLGAAQRIDEWRTCNSVLAVSEVSAVGEMLQQEDCADQRTTKAASRDLALWVVQGRCAKGYGMRYTVLDRLMSLKHLCLAHFDLAVGGVCLLSCCAV